MLRATSNEVPVNHCASVSPMTAPGQSPLVSEYVSSSDIMPVICTIIDSSMFIVRSATQNRIRSSYGSSRSKPGNTKAESYYDTAISLHSNQTTEIGAFVPKKQVNAFVTTGAVCRLRL